MKLIKYIISGLFASTTLLIGCVDADLEEVLDYKNHYQTSVDADNAILGIYGSFMGLAEQTVVLNELRADLMDVTVNASKDLQEINQGRPSAGNKYADPTNFYNIIINCNDVLSNLDIMHKTYKITDDEYAERYSDIAALRCWVYLQLGIHFGEISYFTDPLVSIDDVIQAQNQPTVTFDDLLAKLISCMENVPTLLNYVASPLVQYQLDGYDLKHFFIDKRLLLGDLYLWRGDYLNAATQYRAVLATNEDISDESKNHRTYKCHTYVWNASNEPGFQIAYFRYRWDDIKSYRNNWCTMFELPAENTNAANELIWTLSYDKAFAPAYPFISLFANQGRGAYQLKPSQNAIDTWESQVQTNEFVFDGRGRDSSFKNVNGEYVVQKYLYSYDLEKPFEQSGRWFLYRAGLLHLRYAEAANRAGYPKLAYAMVNTGVKNVYVWDDALTEEQRQSGWGPGNYYPAPFYLDGRSSDTPYYRRPWRDNNGIRGRANLKAVEFPADVVTTNDSIYFMEKVILEEAALECAYEGHRWGDLVRVARRMNKEGRDGTTYLNDVVRKKYEVSGTTMPDLSSEEKWYLPFNK